MDAARVTREARGRAGLTQRELARAAGMPQPAVARIETGDVVPRVDTLVGLLAACGAALTLEKRPREEIDRSEIRTLLRLSIRQRLLSLPKEAGSRFRPLDSIEILTARRVRFVVTGEVAARLHGAPVTPGVLEIALRPERVNSERLARALEGVARRTKAGQDHPILLRDLRGRRRLRTGFGTLVIWWPPGEPYQRLEGAATQMQIGRQSALIASIDDVMERWRRSANELELLAAVREEMDLSSMRARRKRVTQRKA